MMAIRPKSSKRSTIISRKLAKINIKRTAIYIVLAIITTILGLLSRSSFAVYLPNFVAEYAGDVLWATLAYFGLCVIRPKSPIKHIAIATLLFSFAIEFSQFYHAPWIDGIRATTLGGLVLGFGFKLTDLVCYTIGVALGIGISFLVTYLLAAPEPSRI